MSRVYLVGFMGSGKTTVGRLLAERLGVPFVDLDQVVESMSGKTIREMFEAHGEPWFRQRESELLRGTADLPEAVVALGGGTFAFPENAAFVQEHGVSVFLDVSFDVIAARIRGKGDRPLFRSLEEARKLYEARIPWYKIATWAISVSESEGVSAVVDRVETVVRKGAR